MMADMFVYEQIDENGEETGYMSLNICFDDAPDKFHTGYMHEGFTRAQMVEMLRDLAMHIEYNITSGPH